MTHTHRFCPLVRPDSAKYWYSGKYTGANVDPVIKRAHTAFVNIQMRCENKKSSAYPYYGALGIKYLFNVRELIGWYVEQQSKKNLSKPSLGRIDHSKDYSFENLELIEVFDNIRECNYRIGIRNPAGVTGNHIKVYLADSNKSQLAGFYGIKPLARFINKTAKVCYLALKTQRQLDNYYILRAE